MNKGNGNALVRTTLHVSHWSNGVEMCHMLSCSCCNEDMPKYRRNAGGITVDRLRHGGTGVANEQKANVPYCGTEAHLVSAPSPPPPFLYSLIRDEKSRLKILMP